MKEQHGRIGNLPANINIMNPVPSRNGSEHLRSLPDGSESNNLGDLPTTPESFQ